MRRGVPNHDDLSELNRRLPKDAVRLLGCHPRFPAYYSPRRIYCNVDDLPADAQTVYCMGVTDGTLIPPPG